MIYHGLSSLSWFIMIYHHFNRYFIIGILSSFSLAHYMAYYMGVASQKQTEGSSDAMRKTLRPILAMCTSTSRALEENHTLPLPLELSNLSWLRSTVHFHFAQLIPTQLAARHVPLLWHIMLRPTRIWTIPKWSFWTPMTKTMVLNWTLGMHCASTMASWIVPLPHFHVPVQRNSSEKVKTNNSDFKSILMPIN